MNEEMMTAENFEPCIVSFINSCNDRHSYVCRNYWEYHCIMFGLANMWTDFIKESLLVRRFYTVEVDE